MESLESQDDDSQLPVRDVECDRLRRRRFLQYAVGGLGVAALGSNLASALQQGGGPPQPKGDCTTTETYTWSLWEYGTVPPITATSTYSYTTPYRPTSVSYTASMTEAQASLGTWWGTVLNDSCTATYSETMSDANPGTATWSQSCSGGTLSVTYSFPTHGTYLWLRTVSESGIRTATCIQGGFLRDPEPWRLRAFPAQPPTLDAGASVLLARTRTRGEYHLPELG